MRPPLSNLIGATALALSLCLPAQAWTPTHRVKTPRGQIVLRAIDEQSILFAYAPGDTPLPEVPDSPLWSPKAVAQHKGGTQLEDLAVGEALEVGGSTVRVYLDPVTRDVALDVRQPGRQGTTTRLDFSEDGKGKRGLRLRSAGVDHLYGLGEQLPPELLGRENGDLLGHVRYPGTDLQSQTSDPKGVYGNSMVELAGGAAGNAMFPVLYMVDTGGPDTMLFLDNPAMSRWDFTSAPWKVELSQGPIAGALAWNKECGELRRQYMDWTGHAPVPPRKAFGLWVSEYGYENWEEIESKAASLATDGFPVDGFVMDLQWFGGIKEGSPDSRMGALTFDTTNFPDPAAHIAQLAKRGLGLIVIEEAYIASGLPEFAELASKGFLIKSKAGTPQIVDETPWWGVGSMLDYTNFEASSYWHKTKREALRQMGILGHWTDLGEPEMFRHVSSKGKKGEQYETPLYYGDTDQLAANNLFAFRWAESIYRGFGGESARQRPLILGRTGTSGIQRFGTAMWSGDIGANWESLRSHYRAQSNVSLSGMDYYGSDVGGFYRRAYNESPGGYDELYTRWFAAACLTDIPLRPHTMNLGNKFETAPNRVGHTASNLANLKQRYRLIPYLYSQAHRAYQDGSPLISPPVAHSQGIETLDISGTHKWIGADLFARLVLEPNKDTTAATLPKGRWYDFETGEKVSEGGGETLQVPCRYGELRRTPLFARGGAIIPLGSEQTSQPNSDRLELAVFPGSEPWQGALVEDDGWSQAYRQGGVARTALRQSAWTGRYGTVTIDPRDGSVANLSATRDIVLRIASGQKSMTAMVDGQEQAMAQDGEFWTLELPGRLAASPTVIYFR